MFWRVSRTISHIHNLNRFINFIYRLLSELENTIFFTYTVRLIRVPTIVKAKAQIDYHIEVWRGFYSAPYNFLHREEKIKCNDLTVEIYHKGKLHQV